MRLKSTILLFSVILTCCHQQEATLVDADGNEYFVKKYGETVWMTENLKVMHDQSGTPIKFYFPNEDATNLKTFGLLYDFETACQVCPKGWKLPTNEDWKALLKSNKRNMANIFKDSKYWEGEVNTNTSLFSVRPAGYGNSGEHPNNFNTKAILWSDSKEEKHFVWTFIFEAEKDSIRKASQHPTYAFSIRCVKSKSK